jgi:hypothetical protein
VSNEYFGFAGRSQLLDVRLIKTQRLEKAKLCVRVKQKRTPFSDGIDPLQCRSSISITTANWLPVRLDRPTELKKNAQIEVVQVRTNSTA